MSGPGRARRPGGGCATGDEPAGGDDVADAGEARERQRVRAGGDPEPGHLGQAAGHQPRLAVVAEAELLRRARRDRDDVLERAAQLDAEHVAVHVEPEPTAARGVPGCARRAPTSSAATTADAGSRARSRARGWGPTGRRPAAVEAAGLGDDLGHPQVGPGLDALHREHVGRGRDMRRDASELGPDAGRGDGEHDEIDASAIAAGSSVATRVAGRSMPGRRASLRRVVADPVPPSPGSGRRA